MEKKLKTLGIIAGLLFTMTSGHAEEVNSVNSMATTQRICECIEKTGNPNCKNLNATNLEEANRQAQDRNSGAHRPQ